MLTFNVSSLRTVLIKDICHCFSGGTPNTSNRNYYNGHIPFLRSGDIHSDQTELFITEKAIDESSAKMVRKGDLLFALYGATSGECDISKVDGAINQAILCIRLNDSSEIDIRYLKELLCFKKSSILSKYLQGGQGNLSAQTIMGLSIRIHDYKEQQKIAEFFTALDEKIRLENQKLIRFHELKKKLLVNVFSFEDYCETGFFDVVQSLMDYRGKTPLKLGMSWSDVETPYLALSALNVKDQGIDHSKEAHYGTKVLYNKWMKDKPLRPKQILMTTEAPAGVVMQVPDDRPYILSQRVIALDVDPAQVDECFFAYLLRSPFVQKQIERLCSGGTAKGISQKHLRELKVRYPKSIKTQQRIADLFCNIDSRISICAKKLESLEKLKKAFMQRMFV